MNRWRKNRRTLLLSPAAWLLAGPFIRSARTFAAGPTVRPCFVLASKSQGQYPHNRTDLWAPTVTNGQLTLPRALSSFEPVKSSLNFLCGYDLKAMRMDLRRSDGTSDAVDWHHAAAVLFTGGMLANSLKVNDSVAPASHESLDWFVAKRWNTRPIHFNPLQKPGDTPYKNGDRISWRKEPDGSITFVDETSSLQQAWTDVFGGGTSGTDTLAAKRLELTTSILDQTRQDTLSLKRVLGQDQAAMLDAHETALRELELRLTAAAPAPAASCAPPAAPGNVATSQSQADILKRIDDTIALILAIMRCGLRPVIGFHLGHMNGGELVPGLWPNGAQYIPDSKRSSPDATVYHNDLWHAAGDTSHGSEWMQRLEERVNGWVGRLLMGMQGIATGETNLLDASVVLYGTKMSYDHSNENHSFVLAGSGGGKVKTGRVLKTNDLSKRSGGSSFAHNDVLISTLHALGMTDVKTFGTPDLCKGGVSGLL